MQIVFTTSVNPTTVILNAREESVPQPIASLDVKHRSFAPLEDDNLGVRN